MKVLHVAGENMRLRRVSAECRFRGYDASSLTRSLRSGRETAAGVASLRITGLDVERSNQERPEKGCGAAVFP